MKRIRFFTLILFTLLFSLQITFAQEQHPENCPFGGRENCTGYCGKFTDANGDGYCDFSILTKAKKTNKQEDSLSSNNSKGVKDNSIKAKDKSNKTTLNSNKITNQKNNTLEDSNKTSYNDISANSANIDTINNNDNKQINVNPSTKNFYPYHTWQVLFITLLLYLITFILVKANKMRKSTHRKIWNGVLLITSLIACLTGLYVAIAKMYNLPMCYLTLMKWHVDFGISMAIIAVFHILWHITYWKNLIKGGKNH